MKLEALQEERTPSIIPQKALENNETDEIDNIL